MWALRTAGVLVVILFMSARSDGGGETGVPGLRASVEPKRATVGAELVYTLTVDDNGTGLSFTLPEEKPYFPGPADGGEKKSREPGPADSVPLYVVHSAAKSEKNSGGKKIFNLRVVLSYYRPGAHQLPEIGVYDAEKIRVGYRAPEVVIDAVNPSGKLHEIEGPLDLRGNYYRLMIIAVLALSAAAAGYLGFRQYRKRSAPAAVEAEPSPMDTFLEAVPGLKHLAGAAEAAMYGEAASRCFRNFLSARFGVDAMEMTAAELRRFLQGRMPAGGYLKAPLPVEKILELWELSKFAEFAPPATALGQNLDAVVDLARRLDRGDTLVRA